MLKRSYLFVLFILTVLLTACFRPEPLPATAVPPSSSTKDALSLLDSATAKPTAVETEIAETAVPEPEPLPTIILPISIYIIDDADGVASSQRTAEELTAVYQRVNEIWAQANIHFEVQTIERLELSAVPLQAVLTGDFQPFFSGLGREIDIPSPSLLNGFYSQRIGGSNGIAPANTRLFFVMDTPSVHDERVTSHEIGHILGLHHVADDPGRLLFSGTNGMILSPEEIRVARYAAQGILDRLR